MEYSKACELLGFTTPKTVEENARLAKLKLRAYAGTMVPARYLVACQVLIKAAQ